MNHFAITKEIRKIIINNQSLNNLIGNKVFPLIADKDTIGDFIVYQRDGYANNFTKMGIYKQSPLVFINVVSENYDRSQQIAGLLYDALIGTFLLDPKDTNSLINISLEDSTEDIVDNKFIQVLLLKIEV